MDLIVYNSEFHGVQSRERERENQIGRIMISFRRCSADDAWSLHHIELGSTDLSLIDWSQFGESTRCEVHVLIAAALAEVDDFNDDILITM